MNEYILMITFSSILTDLHPASSAGDRARLPSKASTGDLSSEKEKCEEKKYENKEYTKIQFQMQKKRNIKNQNVNEYIQIAVMCSSYFVLVFFLFCICVCVFFLSLCFFVCEFVSLPHRYKL